LNTRVKFKTNTPSNYAALMGCRNTGAATGDNSAFGIYANAGYKAGVTVLGVDFESAATFNDGEVTTFEYRFVDGGASTISINGGAAEQVAIVNKADIVSNPRELYIYGVNKNGSLGTTQEANKYEVGRITMSTETAVVYDFIPAYEEATSTYGYYERINGVFHPNMRGNLIGGNWG